MTHRSQSLSPGHRRGLWISDGQILPCPVVNATLSADHRVSDGHAASALLVAVDRLLQEPEEP